MTRKYLTAAALASVLAAAPAIAQTDPMANHSLFGISGQSHELIKYSFDSGEAQTIGTVSINGAIAQGIHGTAYVPGNTNIFGFWLDPTDGNTKLMYINHQTAQASVVGQDLGPGQVTAATIAALDDTGQLDNTGAFANDPAHAGLIALQNIETGNDTINFDIDGGHVVPTEDFAAKVTVLGAAISYGGAYDMPVTVKIKVGGNYIEPFGSSSLAVDGNVNDAFNPRHYILPSVQNAGTAISIKGTSWKKKSWSYSGSSNSHWKKHLSVNSDDNSPAVLTLRNGDPVPNIVPFQNQSSILDFIKDYIDENTNTMLLDENQAIYLFEIGTTNLSNSAADFQDLVVLVTLAEDPADLVDVNDGTTNAPASRLIKVDAVTGGFEQIMTLDRIYEGLASSPDGTFYATNGQQLFHLDPFNQTSSLVSFTAYPDVNGLEVSNGQLLGFTTYAGHLEVIDVASGQAIGSPVNVGNADLETIVFIKDQLFTDGYD